MDVSERYAALTAAPSGSPAELEGVLRRWDALWADLRDQEVEVRSAVHLGRRDPAALTAWLESVGAARERGEHALRDSVLASPALPQLDPAYGPFVRQLDAERRTRPAGVEELEARIEAVGARWWSSRRAWQPAADAYAASRSEATWRAMGAAQQAVASEVSESWTELAELRASLASASGLDSFVSWCWAMLARPYSVDEADALCDRIAAQVVPWLVAHDGEREPWELTSARDTPDVLDAQAVMLEVAALDPTWAQRVDVECGPHVRGGASHVWRPHLGRSLVFVRPTGTRADRDSLVHELGHALHASLAQGPMRAASLALEVSELASIGLERLVDGSSAGVLRTMRTMASAAAAHRFQRWAYAEPGASAARRADRWAHEWRTMFPHHRSVHPEGWVTYPHLALYPFYCLEYAIAGLGALALAAHPDRADAVARYLAVLRCPRGTSAVEAYAAGGLSLMPTRLDPLCASALR
ncbi:MAG: hypothetical protein ABMA64_11400 [Myxococcota bacterium]